MNLNSHFMQQVWRFVRVAIYTLIPVIVTENYIPDRYDPIAIAIAALLTGGAEVVYRQTVKVVKVDHVQGGGFIDSFPPDDGTGVKASDIYQDVTLKASNFYGKK